MPAGHITKSARPERVRLDAVDDTIDTVNLAEFADREVLSMSGGQRSRTSAH